MNKFIYSFPPAYVFLA